MLERAEVCLLHEVVRIDSRMGEGLRDAEDRGQFCESDACELCMVADWVVRQDRH
ncbi:MAG: hypothetical protein NVS1B4_08320 [Gemmatimonadaceae bacterium]